MNSSGWEGWMGRMDRKGGEFRFLHPRYIYIPHGTEVDEKEMGSWIA